MNAGWTNEKPTHQGWYWWRKNAKSHVWMAMVKHWANHYAEVTFYSHGCSPFYETVASVGGEWSGLLLPPPSNDTERLNFILDLIYREGTSGLIDMKWSNPAEDDSMEEDDSIFDRACIDAAMRQNPQPEGKGE